MGGYVDFLAHLDRPVDAQEEQRWRFAVRVITVLAVPSFISLWYVLYIASPEEYPGWFSFMIAWCMTNLPAAQGWTYGTYNMRGEMPAAYTVVTIYGLIFFLLTSMFYPARQVICNPPRYSIKRHILSLLFLPFFNYMLLWWLFLWTEEEPRQSAMRGYRSALFESKFAFLLVTSIVFYFSYYFFGMQVAYVRRIVNHYLNAKGVSDERTTRK